MPAFKTGDRVRNTLPLSIGSSGLGVPSDTLGVVVNGDSQTGYLVRFMLEDTEPTLVVAHKNLEVY